MEAHKQRQRFNLSQEQCLIASTPMQKRADRFMEKVIRVYKVQPLKKPKKFIQYRVPRWTEQATPLFNNLSPSIPASLKPIKSIPASDYIYAESSNSFSRRTPQTRDQNALRS